jgi:hypothetical protein
MRCQGDGIEGLEHGKGWALRSPDHPASNRLVGDHPAIPGHSLRRLLHSAAGGEGGERLLEQPADCAIWGEGLEHSWGALQPPTLLTVRWAPAQDMAPAELVRPGEP